LRHGVEQCYYYLMFVSPDMGPTTDTQNYFRGTGSWCYCDAVASRQAKQRSSPPLTTERAPTGLVMTASIHSKSLNNRLIDCQQQQQQPLTSDRHASPAYTRCYHSLTSGSATASSSCYPYKIVVSEATTTNYDGLQFRHK